MMHNEEDTKPNIDDWTDEEELEDDMLEEMDEEVLMAANQQRDDTVEALLTLAHGGPGVPPNASSSAAHPSTQPMTVQEELNEELSHARRMQVKVSRMFLAASATFETMGAAVLEMSVAVDDDTIDNMKFTESDVDAMVGALQQFSRTLKGVCAKVGERTGDDLKREVALNTAPHPTAPPSHTTPHSRATSSRQQASAVKQQAAGGSRASRVTAVHGGNKSQPAAIGKRRISAPKRYTPSKRPLYQAQQHQQPLTRGTTETTAYAVAFVVSPSSRPTSMQQLQMVSPSLFDGGGGDGYDVQMPMLSQQPVQQRRQHQLQQHARSALKLRQTSVEKEDEITPAKLMARQIRGEKTDLMVQARRDISKALGGEPSSSSTGGLMTSPIRYGQQQPYMGVSPNSLLDSLGAGGSRPY